MNKKLFLTILLVLLIALVVASATLFFNTNENHKPLNALFLYKQGGKYGYRNRLGIVVILLKFDNARDFSDGMAPVSKNSKYGFINAKGELVIDYQFDENKMAYDLSDGLALVREVSNKKGFYYFINKEGKKVLNLPEEYYCIDPFHYGIAGVWISRTGDPADNIFAHINKKGEIVKPHY